MALPCRHGRRVSTESYVSEERSSAEERSGGHPDWTIKGGSCSAITDGSWCRRRVQSKSQMCCQLLILTW
ncbi:hypothetical protein Q8A67_002223 [Cirrhinus molitorella]|uniref:Uncharacterized protein n=1 Tax=Cirrhinus molitorella TaxID=172907 RepID=A0AA88TXQ5_9TELE|nr:hypothetical protein Q8A67_002223 [Cirrhinus molitorella]